MLFTHKQKLTDENVKDLHYTKFISGLPKIHQRNFPLRPIISSISSPHSTLSKYLLKVMSTVYDKSNAHLKNGTHFIEELSRLQYQNDILTNFNAVNPRVSLYNNVPLDKALVILRRNNGAIDYWYKTPTG